MGKLKKGKENKSVLQKQENRRMYPLHRRISYIHRKTTQSNFWQSLYTNIIFMCSKKRIIISRFSTLRIHWNRKWNCFSNILDFAFWLKKDCFWKVEFPCKYFSVLHCWLWCRKIIGRCFQYRHTDICWMLPPHIQAPWRLPQATF